MKRIISITFFSLFALCFIQAQQLPDFVKLRIDSVHKAAQKSLMHYRSWDGNDGYMTLPYRLGYDVFGDDETELIDSLGLSLSISMIYDNEMRNRLVQLLRNEYRDDELDTLVNRQMRYKILSHEREAIQICRFDTMSIFKLTVDSFYTELRNKNPEDSLIIKYDYIEKNKSKYDVFRFLQLDTTIVFKQAYNKIVARECVREREDYLTDMYSYFSNIGYLAELCGYIGDKRFIQPLIEIFDKPFEFENSEYESQWQESIYKKVSNALCRMHVEPYYSNYIKKRTLTMEQIKDEKVWLDFEISDFVFVLGTQDAFFELSKYLLSNKPYMVVAADYIMTGDNDNGPKDQISPVSNDAFHLIRDNIENEDIQKMIGIYREDIDVLLKPLYDWMQKNYGMYKIKRIW